MSSSASSSAASVQKDWNDREFTEVVQLNVIKISSFLNTFDSTVRSKLSKLNEKLNKLERNLTYCEAACKTTRTQADEGDFQLGNDEEQEG